LGDYWVIIRLLSQRKAEESLPDITAFPTSLLVENDTIKQVMVGELPNPYFIETNKTKITH